MGYVFMVMVIMAAIFLAYRSYKRGVAEATAEIIVASQKGVTIAKATPRTVIEKTPEVIDATRTKADEIIHSDPVIKTYSKVDNARRDAVQKGKWIYAKGVVHSRHFIADVRAEVKKQQES